MATITDNLPTTESSADGVETGGCEFVPAHEPWSCRTHVGGHRSILTQTECSAVLLRRGADRAQRRDAVVVAAEDWADHPTPANIGALHAAVARYRGQDDPGQPGERVGSFVTADGVEVPFLRRSDGTLLRGDTLETVELSLPRSMGDTRLA